ncbi:MAG: GntR family transcriptional regulator [Rhodobacteraceae bacterium]|nr:GntR family transcriptional regulator [Paracoccaceae bacterium]
MNRIEPAQTLAADQAYERFVAALHDGTLPSSSFFSMSELVDLIAFPLASVREAVKRAEALGFVEVLPKRGVRVMDAGGERTVACLDLRAVLDSEGARRLIARGGSAALSALRRDHEAMLAAAAAGPEHGLSSRAIAVDLSLHDALSEALDNPLLQDCYAANRTRVAIIQHTRPFLADRIASAMQEHLAILDALEAGDPEAAVAGITHHFRQTLRWWGVAG